MLETAVDEEATAAGTARGGGALFVVVEGVVDDEATNDVAMEEVEGAFNENGDCSTFDADDRSGTGVEVPSCLETPCWSSLGANKAGVASV